MSITVDSDGLCDADRMDIAIEDALAVLKAAENKSCAQDDQDDLQSGSAWDEVDGQRVDTDSDIGSQHGNFAQSLHHLINSFFLDVVPELGTKDELIKFLFGARKIADNFFLTVIHRLQHHST